MDADTLAALIGSTLLTLLIRFGNIGVAWLARVAGVDAPEPIPDGTDD
jgi:hypothetical protein